MSSNIKFSQLPNLGTITANTTVPVVAAGTNYTITAANLQSYVNSSTGNVTANYFIGNGSQLTGLPATYGNANVVANLAALGSNPVSTTGNVIGNYVLGNGALLTGVITSVANINSGTSNVTVVSSGGNITVGVGGTSNVAVFATTGEYVTGVVSASGNITGGNVLTAGIMSSTGNATHGNILTAGLVSATANVTGGNITTAGLISATGNITGGNISATNHTGTTVSVIGNITAGNVINTGISSVTGNITAGNVLTGGVVSATGNITTANYFVGNLVGTTVSTTGNVYAGNVIINGQSTTYGVVTPAYMVVGLVTSVSGFGNGSTFILDTVISNTNSQTSYNASTGVFTLTAGVTYDMSFTPSFITFSNTTGGFFCYDWVDATSNVQLDTTGTGTGTSISSQDTTAQQDNGTARVIYTPNTNQTVKLRVTNASGTVTLRGGIGTQAIIKPLNPTIAVQATSFGNVSASGYVSATGNVTGGNVLTSGIISATGNVIGGNLTTSGLITVTGNIQGGNLRTAGLISATGNVTGNYILGNGSGLTNVATQVTGSWTVPTGNSTQSFTVPINNTYQLWVLCTIPNGIISYQATVSVTNTNVPVLGTQRAWNYTGGGSPILLTTMPTQIVGAEGTISTAVPATTNANQFDFGINNTSGNSQTVNYGYTKIS